MLNSKIEFSKLEQNLKTTYTSRLRVLCNDLTQLCETAAPNSRAEVSQLFQAEFEWLQHQPATEPAYIYYRAFILILHDLLKVSWQLSCSTDYIELLAPKLGSAKGLSREEQQALKQAVRDDLYSACQAQLAHKATQDFVRSMESPSPYSKSKKSVKLLLADGKELANRLETISLLPEVDKVEFLRTRVKPYLQLVEADERDQFTGHKLGDIWRYFRLTWSIPNTPVPGRKLYYLVRDAAHPYHAVMAIAALSNSSLQVKDRDDFIGWTTDIMLKRFKHGLEIEDEAELTRLVNLIETYVESGLSQIDPNRLVSSTEIIEPSIELLESLKKQAQGFFDERQQHLRKSQTDTNVEPGVAEALDLQDEPTLDNSILRLDKKASEKVLQARRQLVFKKRARAFYQLLYARHELQHLSKHGEPLVTALNRVIRKDSFRSALTYALYSNKGEKVGTNILDITTCGGIPPYSNLLSGKLVALLLLSPQITKDYRERYSNKYSLIASQIKGEKVLRDCNLVFLSTTSLYAVGSSQYNRLTLPAGTIHPEQPPLDYKNSFSKEEKTQNSFLALRETPWQTSGYGTVHFAAETTQAVVQLGIQATGFREVNNVFGEGPSPKLRKIRNGLATLGLNPDVLLRHNQPRLLYCVELCPNARQYLNGQPTQLPNYLTAFEDTQQSTEKITAYWQVRWLLARLRYEPIWERLREFNPASFTLQVETDLINNTDIYPKSSFQQLQLC